MTLRTASGKLCQISNSRRATYGYDQRIEAHGAKGLLRAGNVSPTTVELANAAGFPTDPALPFFLERYAAAYRAELDAFIRACVGRGAGAAGRRGRAAGPAAGRRGGRSGATGRHACGRAESTRHAYRPGDRQPGASAVEELLPTAAGLGIEMLEFGCGNWSRRRICDLDTAAGQRAARAISWRSSRPSGCRSAR